MATNKSLNLTPASNINTNVKTLSGSGINQAINTIDRSIDTDYIKERQNQRDEENSLVKAKQINDKYNTVQLLNNLHNSINQLDQVTDDDNEDTIKEKANKIKQLMGQASEVANQYGLTNTAANLLQNGDKEANTYKQDIYNKYSMNLANKIIKSKFVDNVNNQADTYKKAQKVYSYADNISDPEIKAYYLKAVSDLLSGDKDKINDAHRLDMSNDLMNQRKEKEGSENNTVTSFFKGYSLTNKNGSIKSLDNVYRDYETNGNKLDNNSRSFIAQLYNNKLRVLNVNNTTNIKKQQQQILDNINKISINNKSISSGSNLEALDSSIKYENNFVNNIATSLKDVDPDEYNKLSTINSKINTLYNQLKESINNNDPAKAKEIKQQIINTTKEYYNIKENAIKHMEIPTINIDSNINPNEVQKYLTITAYKTGNSKLKQITPNIINAVKNGYITELNPDNLYDKRDLYPVSNHLNNYKSMLSLYYIVNGGNDTDVLDKIKNSSSKELYTIAKKDKILKNLVYKESMFGSNTFDVEKLDDAYNKVFSYNNKDSYIGETTRNVNNDIFNLTNKFTKTKINNYNIPTLNVSKDININKFNQAEKNVIADKVIEHPYTQDILNKITHGTMTTTKALNLFKRAYKNNPDAYKAIEPELKKTIRNAGLAGSFITKYKKFGIFEQSKDGGLYFNVEPDYNSNNKKRLKAVVQMVKQYTPSLKFDINKLDDATKNKFLLTFYSKLSSAMKQSKNKYSVNKIPINSKTINIFRQASIETVKQFLDKGE